MMPQQYCLRWKHHHSNVQNMFAQLLEKERFCDVTLYCSPSFAAQVPKKDTVEPQSIRGVSLRAHRVVLAACSELLGTLLGAHEAHGEPVLVIDGAEPKHLKALLDYMYTGEMNVHHSQLASLLKTAEELRIKGLTDIRWNNKDEPPDCASGTVATTTVPKQDSTDTDKRTPEKPLESKKPETKRPETKRQEAKKSETKKPETKKPETKKLSPDRSTTLNDLLVSEPKSLRDENDRFSVNGGPPPLIKLPMTKSIATPKRDASDSESPSPKRPRLTSANEQTDDDSNGIKTERDTEWQHGNMDISASRVVGWGGESGESRDESDDEWADAPADIGSFLHTRLRVDGDNSADDESNDSRSNEYNLMREVPLSVNANATAPAPPVMVKTELAQVTMKPTMGPKSGPTDPRFTDVIKLNDYLQHGRRPQFWEENYVKRVMEAVRLKELEMKQAAEILGVSYGTLYGRYRDVYGCINRPYRAVRDFWQVKGPSEVLERLQRGEITIDSAASALGVSVANLAAHVQDFPPLPAVDSVEFEPIPIEVDPSLRSRTISGGTKPKKPDKLEHPPSQNQTILNETLYGRSLLKIAPKVVKCQTADASDEDDNIPATIISAEGRSPPPAGGKWPAIRVASIDSLRSEAPSASQLMRTRPDLTIVPKKPDGDNT